MHLPFRPRLDRRLVWLWLSCIALLWNGCGPPPSELGSNKVYLKKQEQLAQTTLSAVQADNIGEILTHLFGTANQPKIPKIEHCDIDQLMNVQQLQLAAGASGRTAEGQRVGLYRSYCTGCHAIGGSGAGATSALLNPYPRDFRRGIFKFKSTLGPNTPPSHADLMRVLQEGLPGTSMPAFTTLGEHQLECLTMYVRYLAIRGMLERELVFEAVDVLEPDELLVDFSLQTSNREDFDEQIEFVQEILADITDRWNAAEQAVIPVAPRPDDWQSAESVARGDQLFHGDVANCLKCHGEQGYGDGQTTDYDAWTQEFYDPLNPKSAASFIAAGALPPRTIRPRNLRQGIFRGGSAPEHLYRRIYGGIAGTPMPAAPLKPEGAGPEDQRLTTSDIWCLVAYVLSLSGT